MTLSDEIKMRVASLVDEGGKSLSRSWQSDLYMNMPYGGTPSIILYQDYDSEEEYYAVCDEIGIYFEAMKQSRLEWMVKRADERLALLVKVDSND